VTGVCEALQCGVGGLSASFPNTHMAIELVFLRSSTNITSTNCNQEHDTGELIATAAYASGISCRTLQRALPLLVESSTALPPHPPPPGHSFSNIPSPSPTVRQEGHNPHLAATVGIGL